MKYLKIASILCILFLSDFASQAQTSRFSIGPTWGPGHSWIRNTPWSPIANKERTNLDPAFKPSFSAGITTQLCATRHISIGMDLLYFTEGDRRQYGDGDVKTQLDLHYFRIPMKFAWNFGQEDQKFRPQVAIGPSVGFLTLSRGTIAFYNQPMNFDVRNRYNTLDIGVQLSAGFSLQLGARKYFRADLNYYQGMSDINTPGFSNTQPANAVSYNSNLGLRFGFLFGI